MSSKPVFVTCLHGNEVIPLAGLAAAGIPQVVGNPAAVAAHQRFVEKDLNASFGTDGTTIEEERGRQLLRAIPADAFVIDFHTFSSQGDAFAIVVDPKLIESAMDLGLKHVVYMQHNIKGGHALINHRQGISVEVGNHHEVRGMQRAQSVARLVLKGKKKRHPLCRVYTVYGRITNPGTYKNFTEHAAKDGECFYPVLAGENAYNFFGLKAKLGYNTDQENL